MTDPKGCKLIALLRADIGNYEMNRRIYSIDYASPSITVFSSHIPRILIEDHNDPETQTETNIEVKDMDRQEKQLGPLRDWAKLKELIDSNKLTVRKLTPRECWRLMDMTDEDFDRAAAVSSDTQLYKQAGNSIVVVCLEAIFENILINGNTGQKSLMDY